MTHDEAMAVAAAAADAACRDGKPGMDPEKGEAAFWAALAETGHAIPLRGAPCRACAREETKMDTRFGDEFQATVTVAEHDTAAVSPGVAADVRVTAATAATYLDDVRIVEEISRGGAYTVARRTRLRQAIAALVAFDEAAERTVNWYVHERAERAHSSHAPAGCACPLRETPTSR